MNFKEELQIRAAEIETKLKDLYKPSGYCVKLDESVNYTLFSGGKRLRPVLLLSTYRMLGGKDCDSIFLLAIAIEMLHNFTLIHDDLPYLDNDDFRRGKPTNHKLFGEATALLAGDALLSLAHEFIYKAIVAADNKSLYLTAAELIARLTGPDGTIGGQALELLSDEDELKTNIPEIINGKTCKLISASVLSGAIVAGADKKTLFSLSGYARNLGYAFQLSDDLLDITEKGSIDKKSFLNFYGEKKTRSLVDFYIKAATENLSAIDADTEFLAEIAQFCAEREL